MIISFPGYHLNPQKQGGEDCQSTQLLTKSSNKKCFFFIIYVEKNETFSYQIQKLSHTPKHHSQSCPVVQIQSGHFSSGQFPSQFTCILSTVCPNIFEVSPIYAWGNYLGFVSVQLAKRLAPNIGWVALLSLELLHKGLSVCFWHPSVLPAYLCHNVSHILRN